eukprot:jgi/Botrbrau1/21998/Bobra.0024s0014.1
MLERDMVLFPRPPQLSHIPLATTVSFPCWEPRWSQLLPSKIGRAQGLMNRWQYTKRHTVPQHRPSL